jgi:hypothetical protein
MEADFVNEYIARLNANLHDAVSKNVMHETRLALLEKALAEAHNEINRLKDKPKKPASDAV